MHLATDFEHQKLLNVDGRTSLFSLNVCHWVDITQKKIATETSAFIIVCEKLRKSSAVVGLDVFSIFSISTIYILVYCCYISRYDDKMRQFWRGVSVRIYFDELSKLLCPLSRRIALLININVY